jgi:hypothetical protein
MPASPLEILWRFDLVTVLLTFVAVAIIFPGRSPAGPAPSSPKPSSRMIDRASRTVRSCSRLGSRRGIRPRDLEGDVLALQFAMD